MSEPTMIQWLKHFLDKYPTKDDLKADLDRIILEFTQDKCNPHSLAFYKRLRNKLTKIEARLEALRIEVKAERISYGEIYELQTLAEFIDSNDVELLQWAGVEEN